MNVTLDGQRYRTALSYLLADDGGNTYLYRANNSNYFVQRDGPTTVIDTVRQAQAEGMYRRMVNKHRTFREAFPRGNGGIDTVTPTMYDAADEKSDPTPKLTYLIDAAVNDCDRRSADEEEATGMTAMDSVQNTTVETANVTRQEVGLATRNHGFLVEALRYPVTPVGMHYLLTHFDVPTVDPATWSLEIGGCVDRPATLTLDDIRSRPRLTQRVTMECAGNGRMSLSPRPLSQPWGVEAVGNGEWTGTPLRPLLEELGVLDRAEEVVFTGSDCGIENNIEQHYERSLDLADALRDEVMLAYELNGQPLPPQHGFPLRLVVPGWYGMGNVKWLSRITVTDQPFEGYQNAYAYRLRMEPDEKGVPVSRIRPRALMIPPGIPDFFSRERTVGVGETTLSGRAWSGFGHIDRVEVTTDGGMTWSDATVEPATNRFGWVGWSCRWDVSAGRHLLGCRATDSAGNRQPVEADWNLGGYANNGVQWIAVQARDAR